MSTGSNKFGSFSLAQLHEEAARQESEQQRLSAAGVSHEAPESQALLQASEELFAEVERRRLIQAAANDLGKEVAKCALIEAAAPALFEAVRDLLHEFNLDDQSGYEASQRKALRRAEWAYAKAGGK